MKISFSQARNGSDKSLINKPEAKRIQPLFKKKFSPMRSQLTSSNSIHSEPKAFHHDLDLKASEYKSLHNEKLEIIRDLITYTSKYENAYSTRARLNKILSLGKDLENLIKSSTEQISIEIKFQKKLINNLEDVKNITTTEKVDKDKLPDDDEDTVKICVNVSGVYCISFITYDRSMRHFDIDLYGENDANYFSYHLNSLIKDTIENLPSRLTECILNNMYFCTYQDRMVLRFRSGPINEEYIVVSIKGHTEEVCVCLKELPSTFELCLKSKSLAINKSDLKIKSIDELKTSGKRHMVRSIIEEKLCFIHGELHWELSEWEVSKKLKKKNTANEIKARISGQKDFLDDYEVVVTSGTVVVMNTKLKIDLIFNTILQKTRILVNYNNQSVKIVEEDFANEFKLLKRLQKVSICSVTMIKSLEFLRFLKVVLFN